jgi:hypothetical protein
VVKPGIPLIALVLAGCAAHGYEATTPHGGSVPPGHMPPPGECRIWYPDRPPGQQPPPGDCGVLQYQVPPGAILVQG